MSAPRFGRRITLLDVARLASVSQATASRALNDDPRISMATRRSVRQVAQELGYVPNLAASGLRARRTRTLGILLPDLADPVHAQIAAGFELEASSAGYTVTILAGMGTISSERRALTVFTERNSDGICLVSSILDPAEASTPFVSVPVVHVAPDHRSLMHQASRLPAGVIRFDDADGIRQAVLHLLACGRRDIAYLGCGRKASNSLRRRTVERVMRRATGMTPSVLNVTEDAWRTPLLAAEALGPVPPDAVICFDDKLALALLDGLRHRGVQVPRDVAVVGYDDIPFAATSCPRLTTVSTPKAEMGRLAARMLLDAISGDQLPPARVLPVRLVVRESSSLSPARPPGVPQGAMARGT